MKILSLRSSCDQKWFVT